MDAPGARRGRREAAGGRTPPVATFFHDARILGGELQASCLSPDYGLIHSWSVFPLLGKAWSWSGGLSLGCLRAVWHL